MADAERRPAMFLAQPHVKLSSGTPRDRRAFALTPLADIMFQLLIFFMLSTSLAPYALLPLAAPAEPSREDVSGSAASSPAAAQVVWHLLSGHLREGAQTILLDDMPAKLIELRAGGIEELVVFVTASALAQDLATTLEALRVNGPPRIQLIGR